MQRDQPEDHDAAWQAIVDNYGDPVLADEEPEAVVPSPAPRPEPVAEDEPEELRPDPDDTFVPPTPPPVPRPPIDRLLAWFGVFGAPAVLLFFVVTGLSMPRLVGWTLVGWFLVGFGYLIARMPGEPREPWDNGAQL